MKKIGGIVFIIALFIACTEEKPQSIVQEVNWQEKVVDVPLSDSLQSGATYLSVYPQIYSKTEKTLYDLTVTVSIRNTSREYPIVIDAIDYYHTDGMAAKSYIDKSIAIQPMETIEVVLKEKEDGKGGTGANFMVDWRKQKEASKPFIEAVMISTSGQQGLSFTSRGIEVQ